MAGAPVVVRGSGDVGSAVAHRLFTGGFLVVISDEPYPAAPRRGMSFTDAIFDGRCSLEGVAGVRIDEVAQLEGVLAAHDVIPVAVGELTAVLEAVEPEVLIDARMRKHARPDVQVDLAPLTIGLGPGLLAGQNTHWVVETQWGDSLGTVLREGSTMELEGEPRTYGGHARDRFVYAPVAGTFFTSYRIGDFVAGGEIVASIDELKIVAPLGGMLRGLVHDRVPVKQGAKVVEVDPRCDATQVFGIGERPGKIADGVVAALREWTAR